MLRTRKKGKNFLPTPLTPLSQKEKNWTPHESMLSLSLAAWNFYFQNFLSSFLASANCMATKRPQTPPKEKKKKNHSSPSPLKKEKDPTPH
jgi:hypothetical protein